MSHNRSWTALDIEELEKLLRNKVLIKEIALILDRSENAIRCFIYSKKHSQTGRKFWTMNEINKCQRLHKIDKLTRLEIANRLNRSIYSVSGCLARVRGKEKENEL